MHKSVIGKNGEDFCCRYYEKLGYKITARNYHSRFGEIDVIAENDQYIVFAEVKTRSSTAIAKAKESVNYSKITKIILTSLDYLEKNDTLKQPRFDVFEVMHENGRIYKFSNNESAFDFDEKLLNGIDY